MEAALPGETLVMRGRATAASEIELLEQARGGAPWAREQLFVDYFQNSRAIRALLSRQVRNPADREEVLHDAYLSLLRSSAPFRGDSRLSTFVYRVVQLAILQRRRSARAPREDQILRLTYDFEGESRERELAVKDHCFEAIEADATADRLIGLVPEPLQTAFRLRVVHELSYGEIARLTRSPINTVSTRIFKARTFLARLFRLPQPRSS